MTFLDTNRAVTSDWRADDTILFDAGPGVGLILAPRRRRDALLARLRRTSLDQRLADGVAPESSRLLAVRAAQLTTQAARARLAGHWDELAARARRPVNGCPARVPIARSQLDAAADEITRVADELRSPRPLSAAGVAVAGLLLTDAGSPLYRVGGSGGDVAAAVARAVAAL